MMSLIIDYSCWLSDVPPIFHVSICIFKKHDKQECYEKFTLPLQLSLNFILEGENNISHKPCPQFFLDAGIKTIKSVEQRRSARLHDCIVVSLYNKCSV